MKLTHTFRRRKSVRTELSGRSTKTARRDRHASWERARYEQAPEMIGHMLHVR